MSKDYYQQSEYFQRNVQPAKTYYLGSTLHNTGMLIELIELLPCDEVYICLPHQSTLAELAAHDFGAKKVHGHLLTASYPIRDLFLKSRVIAQNCIEEIEKDFPDTFKTRTFPQIDFKALATRRMSLTRVYYELSIFDEFMQSIPNTETTRFFFLSFTLSDSDIKTSYPALAFLQKMAVMPVRIYIPLIPDKALAKAFRYQKFKDFRGLRKKPLKFLKYHFHSKKMLFKRPLLKLAMQAEKWFKPTHQSSTDPLTPFDILCFTYSIDIYKVHYYSVLYKPVIEKLLKAGKRIKFILYHPSDEVFNEFQNRFRTDNGTLPSNLVFEHLTPEGLASFIQVSNHRLFQSMEPEAWHKLPSPHRERIGHTQSAYGILQTLISTMNYVMVHNRFTTLVGLEEDADCMTILKQLSKLYKHPFESYAIPSCLPEYSEVYDMVEIDHLFTHHAFVQKLFEDQRLNVKHYHVVGSTEWEEIPPQDAALPKDVQTLIQESDFVLGVFHQPLFTQYHQQVLYDNLVVNFPDIFQRFLDEHPSSCILIKPHRSDKQEAMEAYLPKSDRIKILTPNTSNQLLYKTFDVALAIHSTTLMHSIAHGLPAICLYKYPDYGHYYDFIESMGCLATNSHDEVLAWIRLLKNDPGFHQQVQDKVGAFYRYNQENPASEQILSIINKNASPQKTNPLINVS